MTPLLCLATLVWPAAAGARAGSPGELALVTAPAAADQPPPGRLKVTGVRLPGRGLVDLEVEAFDLLAPDLRFFRDGEEQPVPRFLRSLKVYRGVIPGEPGSRVSLLRTADGRIEGDVLHEGFRYALATEDGALLATAEPDEGDDLRECRVTPYEAGPAAPVEPARASSRRQPVQIPAGSYGARVMVESNHDLYLRFLGDEPRIVERLVSLFAAVSTSLEEGIAVRLQVVSIGLRSRPDPRWTWQEFLQSHPVAAFPRTFVYMVNDGAATTDGGGSLAGICTAYGPGDYSGGAPRDFGWSWPDRYTIAHEIGHVFGSDHTHCYGYSGGGRYGDGLDPTLVRGAPGEPPVDKCWGRETGCYDGLPERQPPRESSIMSYCPAPSASYGAAGRYGVRSERVPALMRATAERAAARYPACLEVLTDAVDLRVQDRTPAGVTLAWNDIFARETAWTLERRVGRGWRAARKLPANATGVTLRGAAAKPGFTYRLRARFRGNVSEPSTSVTLP